MSYEHLQNCESFLKVTYTTEAEVGDVVHFSTTLGGLAHTPLWVLADLRYGWTSKFLMERGLTQLRTRLPTGNHHGLNDATPDHE